MRFTRSRAGRLIGAIVLTGAALLASPGAASAASSTTIYYDVHTVNVQGWCYAALDAKLSGGHYYVRARFHSQPNGPTCMGGVLERAKSGGSYRVISNNYTETGGTWSYTGWHRDDAGYKAKACTETDVFVRGCTKPY
jgi:hypothetical protein